MRIGFFVNDVRTELPRYATTRMALAAARRGHEVWYIGVDDFTYDADDHVRAWAHMAEESCQSGEELLASVRERGPALERVTVDAFDVLMLRNDPSDDASERPWAQTVGLIFGEAAKRHGVLVVNDPNGLARAFSKLYFQYLPPEIRPRTVITRNPADVRRFVEEHGIAVVKPLRGSGGMGVFVLRTNDRANFRQIFDAVSRWGYVLVQEYLAEAEEGDVRLFLMNGRPLMVDGRYAAFRRVSSDGDLRANIHAGGAVKPAEIDDRVLGVAEAVRPQLVDDGMFLVALDVAGDRLIEINVFSPGGLDSMSKLAKVDFPNAIIEDLERKTSYRRRYQAPLDNRLLACL